MTGTYDRATTRLTLSGGGFSVSDIASGTTFGGDLNGGDASTIFYDVGLDPATTYCGTLQGQTTGVIALTEHALFLPDDSGSFLPGVDVGLATTPWVQVYPGDVASDGGVYCTMSLGVVVQGGIGDAGAAGVWTQSYEAGAGLFAGDGGTWTATTTACPPL